MDKLSEIYEQVDRLSRDEKLQLRAHIDQRLEQSTSVIANEDPPKKIAALHAAFAKLREGLSQEELDTLAEAMNSEYIEPLSKSDWFHSDDER
jgi:hypothetical protein